MPGFRESDQARGAAMDIKIPQTLGRVERGGRGVPAGALWV